MNDPGGIFPSDVHRRVLGHLSVPSDSYGWSASQLVDRMRQDASTWFETAEQVQVFLDELEQSGDAHQTSAGWQMTQQGFDRLTGPAVEIEREPAPAPPESAPKRRSFFRRHK